MIAGRGPDFIPVLSGRLPPKTFRHVLSVCELMLDLRQDAGITEDQAVAAGLLHDLCKAMQPEELLHAAEAYGLPISDHQRKRPGLLHGPVAAEESKQTLAVTDSDVYDAIYWHTTGRADWNSVGVALYFADFSEPLRPRPEAREAREIRERDGYEAAVRYVVEAKLGFVEEKYGLDAADIAFRDWIDDVWRP